MATFATVFALIFVAELPGKTTFATILLAARAHPWKVFLGACAAFTIHVAIAVFAGSLLALLPARPLQAAVGAVFLALAVVLWREGGKTEPLPVHGGGFWKAFALIFVAQWGDPSQLATAALAAKYSAARVFVPATLAFWSIAGVASSLGHHSKARIPARALHRLAALVFAALGAGLLAHPR